MTWNFKSFEELSKEELYAILKERVDVFVVEQACPYPEIDGYDEQSWHLYYEDQGDIAAYCRLIPAGVMYDESSIGRVLVKKEYRGSGLAREMMGKAMEIMKNEWTVSRIKLHAQEYLKDFYGSFGFLPVTDVYLEDGIPHIDMIYAQKE
ncbi:ElaA protein [Melghiribacillus thermohalophilus]|uniref:ElaA protein n=1 Tax=Melghiribacillus thermohalophilus TaxID=1324956 RepID=A0A4R3MUZ5_9BACI|nr:GNAT family N-acetyltransferase [Melghiribacillus thermohalophilus]TCT20330.1 ElaA protein [Melghiribacillus thermohalophilus]